MSLLVTGIFTLTPTHCGTGQAAGAVDLPVAREVHTQLPLLPATSLKGIARDDWFRLPADRDSWTEEQGRLYEKDVKPLFGPLPPRRRQPGSGQASSPSNRETADASTRSAREESESQSALSAGALVFLDGMLLCFPVRSLTGGFRLATSPLLLERLRRIARSQGRQLADDFACPVPADDEALLPAGESGPLSLEDIVFRRDKCRPDPSVATLAEALGRFIASDLKDADRIALPRRLVVVADSVLQDLTCRATAIAARIVLSKNKTSDNLWYEETVPPDCLFAAVIANRPGARGDPVSELTSKLAMDDRYTQIGGNATVGQGQCRWVLRPEPEVLK